MRFEYQIVDIGGTLPLNTPAATLIAQAAAILAPLGDAGWELVAIQMPLAYLKRTIHV